MKRILLYLAFFSLPFATYSQGLEDIIVEEIPVNDGSILGGNATTYRIFVDMAADWSFSLVFGNTAHPVTISTTTSWWNAGFGASFKPDGLPLDQAPPSYAYDSWVSAGLAGQGVIGVTLDENAQGYIDGSGAETTIIGIPTATLNLIKTGEQTGDIHITDGSWAALVTGGFQGPTATNRILIGQFTTDGDFSFELNIQLIDPDGNGVKYVANNPTGSEIQFPALTYPISSIPGCTSPTACNYDPQATFDDGSCLEPVENCYACDGESLVMIDTDGDGTCDAEEVSGCTSETACNYDPNATEDDGSCVEPIEDCMECNVTDDGLVMVDTDGDGICDANDDTGCTSPTACNYNQYATVDDGSCLEPVSDCYECLGDELIIIDSDGDGICDAEDISGCTSETACNYNPDATEDDGSCIEPVENCSYCDEGELVLYDVDGDGICDAEDDTGCTSETACNYNEFATNDDGSCLEPVENCLACSGDTLAIMDADNDGVCNAEEVKGCTSETACNYDPEATDDDLSCLEPVENCSECDGEELVLIDSDGDGICDADERGVEDIIVEIYYISDEDDASDTDGGSLAPGSVTYRVYVDLAPNNKLITVYGNQDHELYFETSTYFFNNVDRGVSLGEGIRSSKLNENTLALDSYVTIGWASGDHIGVLKSEDTDGSVVGGANSDGGSESIEGGILKNDNETAGIPLTTADGLIVETGGIITLVPGTDLTPLEDENLQGRFSLNNGGWSNLFPGYMSPDPENRILIAQLTTDGEFSFQFRLQVLTADNEEIKYVPSNPGENEVLLESLNYTSRPGCMSETACNYDPQATIDNGTCLEPVEDCYECDGSSLVIIDADGDGICDAEDDNAIGASFANFVGLNIYPNPADRMITLEVLNLDDTNSFRYVISDISGRVVASEELGEITGNYTKSIDVSEYDQGLYHVRLISEDGKTSTRMISIY